jgi:serine/threonine protein kinase
VFLEILTVYDGKDLQEFADFRSKDSGDQSFHANLEQVQAWVNGITISSLNTRVLRIGNSTLVNIHLGFNVMDLITRMLRRIASERPTAKQTFIHFAFLPFCSVFRKTFCCQSPPQSPTRVYGNTLDYSYHVKIQSSMSGYTRTLAPESPDVAQKMRHMTQPLVPATSSAKTQPIKRHQEIDLCGVNISE